MNRGWSGENRQDAVFKLQCPHGCDGLLEVKLVIRTLPGGTYDVDMQLEHEPNKRPR